jgi:hypothetical protein
VRTDCPPDSVCLVMGKAVWCFFRVCCVDVLWALLLYRHASVYTFDNVCLGTPDTLEDRIFDDCTHQACDSGPGLELGQADF